MTHEEVKKYIKPGVKTETLDKIAYDFIIKNGCTPSFLNYEGYPKSINTSINDEVVHGIPSKKRIKEHIGRFTKLYYQIKDDKIDEDFIDTIYEQDYIFHDIDYRIYL